MSVFKNWLSRKRLAEQDEGQQPIRRETQVKIQRLYDQAVKLLLGAAKDQTHLNLSDISDDTGGVDSPPMKKGAGVVLKKLGPVFQGMKAVGDPSIGSKADQAMQYLSTVGNDMKVGPKDTVGQLLQRMFGKDALDTYGEKRWKLDAQVKPQQPTNDTQAPQDATAPPAGADPTQAQPGLDPTAAAPAPTGTPEMPQNPADGAATDPNSAMMGTDPNVPADPAAPLQSPGGPTPKKPPGGLAMV